MLIICYYVNINNYIIIYFNININIVDMLIISGNH